MLNVGLHRTRKENFALNLNRIYQELAPSLISLPLIGPNSKETPLQLRTWSPYNQHLEVQNGLSGQRSKPEVEYDGLLNRDSVTRTSFS